MNNFHLIHIIFLFSIMRKKYLYQKLVTRDLYQPQNLISFPIVENVFDHLPLALNNSPLTKCSFSHSLEFQPDKQTGQNLSSCYGDGLRFSNPLVFCILKSHIHLIRHPEIVSKMDIIDNRFSPLVGNAESAYIQFFSILKLVYSAKFNFYNYYNISHMALFF